MFPEARLDVQLRVRSGTVAEVAVRSSRLVQAASLFSGRRPDEVTRLLPTVFALCGTAQVLAGLGAMEQAAGLPPSSAQSPARQLMLLAETVAEHGLGLARDWPALIGAEPDLSVARRLKAAMAGIRDALYPAGDWHRPGGGELAPRPEGIVAAIAEARAAIGHLLGSPQAQALDSVEDFDAWVASAQCVPARLLDMVVSEGSAGFGRGPFLPMPEQGPADLAVRLAADHDGQYLAAPESGGRVFETGPLTRFAWHPVVSAIMGRHGPGLLARLVARLVELVSALREMADLVQTLRAEEAPQACLIDGVGLGLVEAARGLLAHRVELEGGRVRRYQILAPTEWNFHPEGPLARGLKGAPARPGLERNANLLAHALDPCVACWITVEHAHA